MNRSASRRPPIASEFGIKSDIGRWEFWTFDLENARVVSPQGSRAGRASSRASFNGRVIYVYVASDTIDLYEAATYRYLRTIHMGADQTPVIRGALRAAFLRALRASCARPAADAELRRAFATWRHAGAGSCW